MKEYGIYQRYGKATPFMIHTFKDLNQAKLFISQAVIEEEGLRRPYFVDNDYYDNKYDFCNDVHYFSILEREITEWKKHFDFPNSNNKQIFFLNNF